MKAWSNRGVGGRLATVTMAAVAILVICGRADAQASRTWVSGVGDDLNPCSRIAPCKTFVGALANTADGGEIDGLDPGGYGAVTITKNVTIDGGNTLASVLVSGTNGIVVNAPGAVVILRNLAINGATTGVNGIRIIAAAEVRIENCEVFRFAQRGISDERTSGRLRVSNTTVHNNGQTGIAMIPAGVSSTVMATIDHVRSDNNGNGGVGITGGTLLATDSVAAGNTFHGFYADGFNGPSQMFITRCTATSGANGITAGAGGTIRVTDSTVTGNTVGLRIGGVLYTYGTNRIDGNGSGNGGGIAISRQ